MNIRTRTGLSILLSLLLACIVVSSQTDNAGPEYYCLEDYRPIGGVLENAVLSTRDRQGTSGQIARQCSVSCSADPSCTAFKAAGSESPSGPSCQLLTNTTAAIPAALSVPSGADWPHVLTDLSANGSVQLRSVGWFCLRGAELWDAFGRATHAAILTRSAAPPYPDLGRQYYCAFGTDTAGTNLQQYTSNIKHPANCDALCANSTTGSCDFWTFVAGQPGSGNAPYNCFIRADPFAGENGYTGKPKADIWVPDSEMECFTRLSDWRQLGLILSPAVKTVSYGGVYYTLYPERVTWQEASRACISAPGSKLAILNSRGAVDIVYRQLLSTLSPETGVTSAWIGASGNNTHYNASAQDQTGLLSERGGLSMQQISQLQPQPVHNRTALGPESTLVWSNGSDVDDSQLRRVIPRTEYWSAHDVIWNQLYVPDSSKDVCGRVLIQTPPTQPVPGVDISSSVLPGLWFFDCTKLAPYICQSADPPNVPMAGRTALDNSTNEAVTPTNTLAPNWRIAVAVIVPVFAVLLIIWQLSCLYSTQVSRLPELIRQQHKRALGQPKHGRMSIVVTDIQGFTNLMRDAPDDMAQALLLHNQVMKHACYQHIGYILEQEGDSFTLAFHEPQDAVAFTLQVQQALLDQPWAPTLVYGDLWEGTTSQDPNRSSLDRRPSLQHQTSSLASPHPMSQRSSQDQIYHGSMLFSRALGTAVHPAAAAGVLNPIGDDLAQHDPGYRASRMDSTAIWSSDPSPLTALSMVETDYGLPPRSAYSRRKATWFREMLSPAQQRRQQQGLLFKGLRVRMGVATGFVRKGAEVKSSGLYKTAQDVSNTALGGQVLLDETTFLGIKEELWRFGLVTASGLKRDAGLVGQGGSRGAKRSAGRRMADCLICRRPTQSLLDGQIEQALALDMGCYELISQSHQNPHPAIVQNPARASPGPDNTSVINPDPSLKPNPYSCALWRKDIGLLLVRNYQNYLQHQLQHRPDLRRSSDLTPADAFISAGSDQNLDQNLDLENGYRQGGSITGQGLGSRGGSGARQHLQSWLNMQQQQQLGMLERQGNSWQQQQQQIDVDRGRSDQGAGRRKPLWGAGFKGRGQNADGFNPETASPRALSMSEVSSWSINQVTEGYPTIRLYQIVAPRLVGRAALFGSQLSLQSGWVTLDEPFFAAPGLTAANDNSSSSTPSAAAAAAVGSPWPGVSQQQQQHDLVPAGDDVSRLEHAAPDQIILSNNLGHQRSGSPPAAAAAAAGDGSNVPDHGSRPDQRQLSTMSPFATAAAAAAAASHRSSLEQSAGSSSPSAVQQQQQRQQRDRSRSPLHDQISDDLARSPRSVAVSPSFLGRVGILPQTSSALIRAMSLRAEWAIPSLIRTGSTAAAASIGAAAAAAGLRAQYPPVTIVFAAVEGAHGLLRYPLLSRPTHHLMQRLMLKTLALYPGSYSVRAQDGDLKYMAAFPTPAAAAEWCLTVQEASLYLPYPLEVLELSNCGVQLDGSGRLVFRGPRFKMGLCEGTPKCIMPDHMGRADYHGPFVNQAARYADAAAHGGQIVTDLQLANKIISYWHSSGSSSSTTAPDPATNHISSDIHPSKSRDSGKGIDSDTVAVQMLTVNCSWLGSFLYKGNPQPLEMVCFAAADVAGRSYPSAAPGGKGMRLVQRVDVMDSVVVGLPAVLEGFRVI